MSENIYTHISPQVYFNLYKDLQQHNKPAKTKEQLDMINKEIIVRPFNVYSIRNKLNTVEIRLAQLTDLLREINEDIKNLPRCPISEGHE
jgi:hypothetical protein